MARSTTPNDENENISMNGVNSTLNNLKKHLNVTILTEKMKI